ncbi:hypothetical protein L3Q82_005021 [Scortum barcoo]|uniref:Uncharacterized protein n=1 Tax=Scortum barcoo TaxID=214431 RepID=A0ACB8VFW8_9TELE|nr:hypothetical protein L3Q82_005021 [Scortum barcoo]
MKTFSGKCSVKHGQVAGVFVEKWGISPTDTQSTELNGCSLNSRTSTPSGVKSKANRIIKDHNHPSNKLLCPLPSSRHYLSIRSHSTRLRDSFIPQAIFMAVFAISFNWIDCV